MRSILCCVVQRSLVAALIMSAAARGAEASAEEAWAKLEPLLEIKMQGDSSAWTRRQLHEGFEQRALLLRDQGEAFLAAFPTDPRRWRVAWSLISQPPRFVKVYGPNIENDFRDVVIDEAAATAWNAKLAALETAMNSAPDLPVDLREALDHRSLVKATGSAFTMIAKGEPVDWDAITQRLFDFASKYPTSDAAVRRVSGAMYAYEMSHTPAESVRQWHRFTASPNTKVTEIARGKVKALEVISGPVELEFTALDGREVDTRKFRGKVVLIDFWATWCGPCMAEMPNVKKVYAAYHDQGFEILGVSCDVAPENASKGSEKAARTGAQVLEFCQKNGMLWPQHYEGRKHNDGGNSLAARFAVTGIPATFLLDQSGNVVAMNVRGEKLESEVKRLLKQ